MVKLRPKDILTPQYMTLYDPTNMKTVMVSFVWWHQKKSHSELFFVFKVLRASFNLSSVMGFSSKDG